MDFLYHIKGIFLSLLFSTDNYYADYRSTSNFFATYHFIEGTLSTIFHNICMFLHAPGTQVVKTFSKLSTTSFESPPNISPRSIFSLISQHPCFCLKWAFYIPHLLCTTSLFSFHPHISLLLLKRLECNQDYVLSRKRDPERGNHYESEFVSFPIIDDWIFCVVIRISRWIQTGSEVSAEYKHIRSKKDSFFCFLVPN